MKKQFVTIYCKNMRHGKLQKRRYILAQFAIPQEAFEYWRNLQKKYPSPQFPEEMFEIACPKGKQ